MAPAYLPKHSKACALVPDHPALPSTLGSCGFPEGKQPLCEATLPGLSPRGRTTRRLPVNWGLRILRENNRNLD